jgi:uncharacterized protein YciI
VSGHFVLRLIAPRPTFAFDMSDEERAAMNEHAEYWRGLMAGGNVVVYGPVLDRTGAWGLAVIEAESEDDARAIAAADPFTIRGLGPIEVGTMLAAILR